MNKLAIAFFVVAAVAVAGEATDTALRQAETPPTTAPAKDGKAPGAAPPAEGQPVQDQEKPTQDLEKRLDETSKKIDDKLKELDDLINAVRAMPVKEEEEPEKKPAPPPRASLQHSTDDSEPVLAGNADTSSELVERE